MMAKFAELSQQTGTQQGPLERIEKENSNPNLQNTLLQRSSPNKSLGVFFQMCSYKLQQGSLECLKQQWIQGTSWIGIEITDTLVLALSYDGLVTFEFHLMDIFYGLVTFEFHLMDIFYENYECYEYTYYSRGFEYCN